LGNDTPGGRFMKKLKKRTGGRGFIFVLRQPVFVFGDADGQLTAADAGPA
jgi:hypothetical protein